jgi:hypothetical protein
MRGIALVVASVGLTACGTGDGTAGLSGRQVAKAHDVADLFFANPTTLAYTRQAAEPSDLAPQALWAWGLSEDAPEIALPAVDWAPPAWWPRQLVGDLLQTGSQGRMFYDFGLRAGTDLNAYSGISLTDLGIPDGGLGGTGLVPGAPVPILVLQRGASVVAVTGAVGRVGVGRPSSLQTFTFDGYLGAMDFLGDDLALLRVTTPESPEGMPAPVAGIYKLTLASGELTALIPTTPLSDWETTAFSCNSFDSCSLFKVVGCAATDPPCPGARVAPCFILYAKRPADNPDVTAAFAYDVNSRGSFRLPGQNPRSFAVSPDQHMVVWESATDPEGKPGVLTPRFWDLCSNVEALCPDSGRSQIAWRPGGGGFALANAEGSLRVADGDLCLPVSGGPVRLLQYSPEGDRLLWYAASDVSGFEGLMLSSWRGEAPVGIAEGNIFGARFTPDGQRLIMARGSADTLSLSWLDLASSPPAEHRLADNYGGFSRGGARRILLVDHWNSQDTSGDLVLIDIASGARRQIGRAVTEFAVSGDVDSGAVDLAYAVRSRVSAPRDGLWLTTLPP